jgi:hypothetical protein
MAALLRVADALDRQHGNVIRSIDVKIGEEGVEIRPVLAEGQSSRLTLEIRAVKEKGAMFEQVFGKPLLLVSP